MMLQRIFDSHPDEEFMIADGLDDAVIGLCESSSRLIYSVTRCIEILISQGMDDDEAAEYFEFNVYGAYMGEKTPIWCYDDFL